MDRETVIQNIVNNYSKNGITREVIGPLVDRGIQEGITYDFIYLQLMFELTKLAGEEFYCTSEDMARAFGLLDDDMNELIRIAKDDLTANGENPDDYFRKVQSQKFIM